MRRRTLDCPAIPAFALFLVLVASTVAARAETTPPAAGDDAFLSLRNGRLYKNGKLYRAAGYNHYIAFGTGDICPPEYVRQSFADAKTEGVKVFRFVVHHNTPRQLIPWITDPAAYWRAHQEIMDLALGTGADLIARLEPGVFWQLAAYLEAAQPPYTQYVPYDVYPKDMAARDNAGFKLLERYLTELIVHYRDDPRIIAWELGNEWDHVGNVQTKDKAGDYQKYFGAARIRLRPDTRVMATSEDYVALSQNIIGVLKAHDPRRLVFPGYGGPREWEYNKWKNGTWKPDTLEEMKAFLAFMHRIDGLAAFGLHFYNGLRNKRFCGSGEYNTGMLALFSEIATGLGLPVYLGEFGDKASDIAKCGDCLWTKAAIARMQACDNIQIACIWAWYPALNPHQDEWRMEKQPRVRAAVRAANRFFDECRAR